MSSNNISINNKDYSDSIIKGELKQNNLINLDNISETKITNNENINNEEIKLEIAPEQKGDNINNKDNVENEIKDNMPNIEGKNNFINNDLNIKTTNNFISENNNINNNEIYINKMEVRNDSKENISRSMSSHSRKQSEDNILSNSFSKSAPSSKSRSRSKSNSKTKNQHQDLPKEKKFGNKFQEYGARKMRSKIKNNNNAYFDMKNGCCRKCMKAFSSNGRSCLCQVPRRERRLKLQEEGCNFCGCHGCSPIDAKYNERIKEKNILLKDKTITHKKERILDSDDENLKIHDINSDKYNKDKKEIKQDLDKILQFNSNFFGFGVPMRTPNYILGYTPNISNNNNERMNRGNINNYEFNVNYINNRNIGMNNNYNNNSNKFRKNNYNLNAMNNSGNLNLKRNNQRLRK